MGGRTAGGEMLGSRAAEGSDSGRTARADMRHFETQPHA